MVFLHLIQISFTLQGTNLFNFEYGDMVENVFPIASEKNRHQKKKPNFINETKVYIAPLSLRFSLIIPLNSFFVF